jgi:hypothetical protein
MTKISVSVLQLLASALWLASPASWAAHVSSSSSGIGFSKSAPDAGGADGAGSAGAAAASGGSASGSGARASVGGGGSDATSLGGKPGGLATGMSGSASGSGGGLVPPIAKTTGGLGPSSNNSSGIDFDTPFPTTPVPAFHPNGMPKSDPNEYREKLKLAGKELGDTYCPCTGLSYADWLVAKGDQQTVLAGSAPTKAVEGMNSGAASDVELRNTNRAPASSP